MHKVFIICILFILWLTSCQSNRATARNILEYQKQVDRLEEELRNRDRAVDSAIRELAAITARSEAMEGDIDSVIRLFDEYQRAIDRLLQYDRSSDTEASYQNKSNHNIINYSYCKNLLNDLWLYYLC